MASNAASGSALRPTLEALGVKPLRPAVALDALLVLLASEARASPPTLTLERHCQQLQYIGMHGTSLPAQKLASLLVAVEDVITDATESVLDGQDECLSQLLQASALRLPLGRGEGCELHLCLAEAGMSFVDPRVR